MKSLFASTHNINQTHQSNTDKWQLPQELLHNKSFVFDCQRQTVQLLGIFFHFGKCPSGFHFNVSHYITIQHSCSRLDESKVSSYKNHLLEQESNSVKTKERIT